jgi:hypothetical protein
MGLRNLYGFGCAVFGPDGDWRRYQGLCFHTYTYIVLHSALRVKNNLAFVITFAVQCGHEAKDGIIATSAQPRREGWF